MNVAKLVTKMKHTSAIVHALNLSQPAFGLAGFFHSFPNGEGGSTQTLWLLGVGDKLYPKPKREKG